MHGGANVPRPAVFLIGGLGLVMVVAAPYGYHLDFGPGPHGFTAIAWELPHRHSLQLFSALEYFPYYLYRFVALMDDPSTWARVSSLLPTEKHTSLPLVPGNADPLHRTVGGQAEVEEGVKEVQ